jgi:predicted nucleic acid-binding protein
LIRYLIDTNAISEIRKGNRANRGMHGWFLSHDASLMALSVVTFGEIRDGIEKARKTDLDQALALERWLQGLLVQFDGQILPVTLEVADRWGRLMATSQLPSNDAWLAATALKHNLIVVTRNVSDFEGTDVQLLNPFT